MKTLKCNKFILTPLAIVLATGCSGPISKSQSLLEAEKAYANAKSDPAVLEYARPQLDEANRTLQAAAQAETTESMGSLAYIADAEIQTAVLTSEKRKSINKFKELSREKDTLMNQSLKQENFKLSKRGMMYSLGDVLFVFGKADLQPGAAGPINQLAGYMKTHPEKTMLIEGHTDNVGSASFNERLSLQRAEYVKSALLQRGIAESRMKAIGLGQSQPIATNSSEAGRQKNRRVEIIFQEFNSVQ
jgi:outer membrane protein OmpA-like peptidoglycan-associated protein